MVNFQNIYLLRDYYYSSEDQNQIYRGYISEKKEIEEIIPAEYSEFRNDLRESFLRYEFVKKHFAVPEMIWNKVANMNQDGTDLIIEKLSIATDNINAAKKEKFTSELNDISKQVISELDKHYHSGNTDEMLQTLSKTNNDVAIIADGLKTTIERINSSSALWSLLNDQSIPGNIRQSVSNIRQATAKANVMATDLHNLVKDIKDGKGSAGALLTDTTFAYNLNTAVISINQVGKTTDSLAREIKNLAAGIKEDVNNGKGTVHALLKDSTVTEKLNASLENIRKGTDGFNQAMDAIKHSFLLRGYIKKQEKKRQQELKNKLSTENK